MPGGIIDNDKRKLAEVIREGLTEDDVTRLRIGVGYFFTSGLKSLLPELEEFIENGGQVDILMGNVVNRSSIEDLLIAYKDRGMARSRQPGHIVTGDEREELRSELRVDFKHQLLYLSPSPENQAFLQNLAEWFEDNALRLRVYPRDRFHAKAYVFESREDSGSIVRPELAGIVGSSNLTASGLTSNTELNASVYTADAEELQTWFEKRWAEAEEFSPELLDVIGDSWAGFRPDVRLASPYLVYLKTIYELYKESLATAEEYLRSFQVYQDLYDFQKWAVLRGAKIARKYDGVLISDVVGMGKTYVGLALLEHFYHRSYMQGRQGKMLLICPKKLQSMWERMVTKYSLNAQVVSMGMLSKEGYKEQLLEEHADTSVVLIDESHHYRNTGTNRYKNVSQFLHVADQVLLLSATPYTKSPEDVLNQMKLFHPEDRTKIPISPPRLPEYFKRVEDGQASLSELLSHVMVRRTRYDIVSQYGGVEDGRRYVEMGDQRRFLPDRTLGTESYSIEHVYGEGFYQKIVDVLEDLSYARYSLGTEKYLRESWVSRLSDQQKRKYQDLGTMGQNLRGLMKANLLKRLESSIFSFRQTLHKMLQSYRNFRALLEEDVVAVGEKIDEMLKGEDNVDEILDALEEMEESGDLKDYDIDAFETDALREDLGSDIEDLRELKTKVDQIVTDIQEDYSKDDKLQELVTLIEGLRSGEREILEDDDSVDKIIVFSEWGDTIHHLEEGLTALQDAGRLDGVRFQTITSDTDNVDGIVERFAPESNEARGKIRPEEEIDLLVSTDVTSEGLNLQDAGVVINYDIHWNPLKLIQRIGRVDRLGSRHETIYAINFLPETTLDQELQLVDKVGDRVDEMNRVLGADGKVLTEEDQLNPGFMERIYEGDMKDVEEYEREVLLGEDNVSGAVNELRRISEQKSELLDRVKAMDGVRSATRWDRPYDAVFVLCRVGEYADPYIVSFDDRPEIIMSNQEEILNIIECDEDDDPVSVDDDQFVDRYAKAADLASREFEQEIRERKKLSQIRESKYRDYVEEGLKELASEIDDEEQAKSVRHIREIIHHVNNPQVLNEFEEFEEKSLESEELLGAVQEMIGKYNLEETVEDEEDWLDKLDEPTHVVAGTYLKGTD